MSKQKTFGDLQKLTIKRSEWLRGTSGRNSGLLVYGKMCCLGFYAKAQGYKDDELKESVSPGALVRETQSIYNSKLVEKYDSCTCDTQHSRDLMSINDDASITDVEREAKLTEKFHSIGVEVEFVD